MGRSGGDAYWLQLAFERDLSGRDNGAAGRRCRTTKPVALL